MPAELIKQINHSHYIAESFLLRYRICPCSYLVASPTFAMVSANYWDLKFIIEILIRLRSPKRDFLVFLFRKITGRQSVYLAVSPSMPEWRNPVHKWQFAEDEALLLIFFWHGVLQVLLEYVGLIEKHLWYSPEEVSPKNARFLQALVLNSIFPPKLLTR